MLELGPIRNKKVGKLETGGMSFEQKKRVSIGVELAANPSILFLDEPTTGLDSRAAQLVMRGIRRVASSGRSVVCTIHQPSYPIFTMFDSLLLLKRGGRTVYFGELGENCKNLIDYFESSGVPPMDPYVNPATWMLEIIGAGTSASESNFDYHSFYKESSLCDKNLIRISELIDTNKAVDSAMSYSYNNIFSDYFSVLGHVSYATSFWNQFKWLSYKMFTSYWRNPNYNFIRLVVSILVALLFGSAYSQVYSNPIGIVSRIGAIVITLVFLGATALQSVLPVAFEERATYYREQQSNMYSPVVYSLVTMLVEVPYIILSALVFVLPFFYIVGFNHIGIVYQKFLYYWLFVVSYVFVLFM